MRDSTNKVAPSSAALAEMHLDAAKQMARCMRQLKDAQNCSARLAKQRVRIQLRQSTLDFERMLDRIWRGWRNNPKKPD